MKLRYSRIGPSTYEVLRQNKPREPWIVLGVVQRFGSLPSMQYWKALLVGDGKWSPSRDTRDKARADLIGRS